MRRTESLPVALYDAAGVRALDRFAIEIEGIPALDLMRRAGAAAWRVLAEYWADARDIVIACGSGNNAGDGYVVARLAADAGKHVRIVQVGNIDRLSPAATACRADLPASVTVSVWQEDSSFATAEVIVDALFGVGLDRPATGHYAEAIAAINAAHRPVLALDVPSGLDASTGNTLGPTVIATVTVTFLGGKQGLLTGAGPDHAGKIHFADLGVPASVYAAVPATVLQVSPVDAGRLLAPRQRSAHKGAFGHALVIGGAPGYAGAARLAAEAAARVGAGLVTVATHPAHAAYSCAARPELMCRAVATPAELSPLIARANVIAIGPGLGQDAWGSGLLATALDSNLPLVVDADALNLLAADPIARGNWILTPHPGEAARLLRTTRAAVQADRFVAVRRLQDAFQGTCVLKGAGSLIAASADDPLRLCGAGNPGMASGGMGDVLTGVIAALVAQGVALPDAATVGVWLHAHAADRAAESGERGMLASDLLPPLRELANPGAARSSGPEIR